MKFQIRHLILLTGLVAVLCGSVYRVDIDRKKEKRWHPHSLDNHHDQKLNPLILKSETTPKSRKPIQPKFP